MDVTLTYGRLKSMKQSNPLSKRGRERGRGFVTIIIRIIFYLRTPAAANTTPQELFSSQLTPYYYLR